MGGGKAHWRYLALGALAAAGSQWLMLWLLARTAEPQLVGIYGLALAWITPLFAFFGLQLRPLLATENQLAERLGSYRTLRWMGVAAACLMAVVLALVSGEQPHFAGVVCGVALLRGAELLSDFAYGLRTRRGELRSVGTSQLIRAIVAVDVFGLLWIGVGNLSLALVASGCGAWMVTLWLDRDGLGLPRITPSGQSWALPGQSWAPPGQSWKPPGELWKSVAQRPEATAILRVALPLAAVMFLNQAVVASPRILLGWWLSLEALAQLSCLMGLLALPGLLAASYSAGLSARFANASATGGAVAIWLLARDAALRVLGVALPVSLLFLVIGGSLMTVLFGDAYRLDRLTLGGAALFAVTWAVASVFGTAATATRHVWPQAIAFVSALSVCLVLAVLLIPRLAIAGATLSLGAAGLALMLVYLLHFHQQMVKQTALSATRASCAHPQERIADA